MKQKPEEEGLKYFEKEFGVLSDIKTIFMSFDDVDYLRIDVPKKFSKGSSSCLDKDDDANEIPAATAELTSRKRKKKFSDDSEATIPQSSSDDTPVSKKYKITPKKLRRLDGRSFRVNGKPDKNITYYKCSTSGCTASAKHVKGFDKLQPLSKDHLESCRPNWNEDIIVEVEDWLKKKLSERYLKFNDLWKEAIKKYPKADQLINFPTIKNQMKKWRLSYFPPKAKNMEAFVKQIKDRSYDHILNYYDHKVSAVPVQDEDDYWHVLFYDEEFIKSYFENCTHLFVDATFKTRPALQDCLQLFIIMGVLSGHAVPLFYVAMSRKTQSAYQAVLNHVIEVHSFKNVKVIMSDFERPLRCAIKSCLTMGTAVGCNFHFDKVILTKLKKLGLQDVINQHPEFHQHIKKFLAIAFLPPSMIQGEFDRQSTIIFEFLREKVADGEILLKKLQSFNSFLDYFQSYWLNIVTPAGFSIFALSKRTNNCCESFNSMLVKQWSKRPVPNDFTQNIVELTLKYRNEVERSKNLILNTTDLPRFESNIKNIMYHRQWKLIIDSSANHPIDVFISAIASVKGDLTLIMKMIENEFMEFQIELKEKLTVMPFEKDCDFDTDVLTNDETLRIEKRYRKAVKDAEKKLKEDGIPFSYNDPSIENIKQNKVSSCSKNKKAGTTKILDTIKENILEVTKNPPPVLAFNDKAMRSLNISESENGISVSPPDRQENIIEVATDDEPMKSLDTIESENISLPVAQNAYSVFPPNKQDVPGNSSNEIIKTRNKPRVISEEKLNEKFCIVRGETQKTVINPENSVRSNTENRSGGGCRKNKRRRRTIKKNNTCQAQPEKNLQPIIKHPSPQHNPVCIPNQLNLVTQNTSNTQHFIHPVIQHLSPQYNPLYTFIPSTQTTSSLQHFLHPQIPQPNTQFFYPQPYIYPHSHLHPYTHYR